MRYNVILDANELKGINYHRMVAKFISDNLLKQYPHNTASVFVYGDKDLLISYLLAENYRIHVMDIGFAIPTNTHRIQIVDFETFPLEEYDIIIGLFTDTDFIKKCIEAKTNFFVLPRYRLDCDANEEVKKILNSNNIAFEEKTFDSFMSNPTAIYNFNLK